MTLLHLDQNDLSMFTSKVDMGKIVFLKKHLDAFLTFYEEQGNVFWFRYIISFRDVMYKHHFQDLTSPMPLCKHEVFHVGDSSFIALHREFIECTKHKKIKSTVSDMMIVVLYYMHKSTSDINPFQHAETKNSFTRFFGTKKLSTFEMYLMDVLLAPVVICFTSNLHTLLVRWMKEKKSPNNTKPSKWAYPTEWTKSKFKPSKFELYIACYYGNTLEKELDLDANIRVMDFQNRPQEPRTLFDNNHQSFIKCACNVKKIDKEESFKKFVFNDGQYICKHRKEDVKGLEYLEVFDPAIEDSISLSCPVCTEEAKKSIIFKLAEDKFRQEEILNEMLPHPKCSGNRKKKRKNKTKSDHPSAAFPNSSDKSESIEECDGAMGGLGSSKPFVANNVILKCKKKGFTEDNLKLIKDNIDKIELSVKEKGSLDTEHLQLMLETGAILKSPETTKPKDNSAKVEPSAPKKSSKTKAKPKKTEIQPIPPVAPVESTPNNINNRSCHSCHKVKDKSVKLKKCALCVKNNAANIRYYCSRECQADDWVKCHKTEHDQGTV